jgi:hypothetical protein
MGIRVDQTPNAISETISRVSATYSDADGGA